MPRYTFDFRRNEDGSIDYDFYRARARVERNETRIRVLRGVWINIIGLMLRSAKRVSKHGAAASFETPRAFKTDLG